MEEIINNLLIGIISGIISGVLVSRIFLVQAEYQNQIDGFENIIKALSAARMSMEMCRSVLELKYDTNSKAKKEAKEKKYNNVEQYFINHAEEDWISASDVIKVVTGQMDDYIERIKNINVALDIKEHELQGLYNRADSVLSKIENIKDIDFAKIKDNISMIKQIESEYEKYKKRIGFKLVKMILKDKVILLILTVFVIMIIACVVINIL